MVQTVQIPWSRKEFGIIKGECCVALAQSAKEQAVLDTFEERQEWEAVLNWAEDVQCISWQKRLLECVCV